MASTVNRHCAHLSVRRPNFTCSGSFKPPLIPRSDAKIEHCSVIPGSSMSPQTESNVPPRTTLCQSSSFTSSQLFSSSPQNRITSKGAVDRMFSNLRARLLLLVVIIVWFLHIQLPSRVLSFRRHRCFISLLIVLIGSKIKLDIVPYARCSAV